MVKYTGLNSGTFKGLGLPEGRHPVTASTGEPLQHGSYFTFYCKLRQVFVKSGDKLSTGDRIGQISTNEDGNAELHFQLWKGTDKQNPETWLR